MEGQEHTGGVRMDRKKNKRSIRGKGEGPYRGSKGKEGVR